MKFYLANKLFPANQDWILMKMQVEFCPSGFIMGYFQEGYMTEENVDITDRVEKWAYLPDWSMV